MLVVVSREFKRAVRRELVVFIIVSSPSHKALIFPLLSLCFLFSLAFFIADFARAGALTIVHYAKRV